MIVAASLLTDLKKQLKLLEADLRQTAEDSSSEYGARLHAEHDRAFARERTAFTWSQWRDGEVTMAAVSWIIATTFVRFLEDNDLLEGARDKHGSVALPWISGPGVRRDRAVENQDAFHARERTTNNRDWLRSAFGVLASLPAGRGLIDPKHSPVWTAPISGGAADELLRFWRKQQADGTLLHDFADESLDTRFLGDLYQDLSDYARDTYALLQTPVFVEEFILDRTLKPAIEEFGLNGLKLIDPTCGSGHFLLGAFERLNELWKQQAPAMDPRTRVQHALDSVYGVDLNPFAVAIARFRLTVAALLATGEPTLVSAPAFGYHLAVGDSLLRSESPAQRLDLGDGEEPFGYETEDVHEYAGILKTNQYHVVVGNPPYIPVKDKALNQKYRELYSTCYRKYALSAPFMELFFRLAKSTDAAGSGAGYVGKITSNSFMKREFGKPLVENFLAGSDPFSPVDLTSVIDSSVAHIPGHNTPTVVIFGRRRKPVGRSLRVVLGLRGESPPPADPSKGKVWAEIVDHVDQPGFDGNYVSVIDTPRDALATHPWSLSGGGARELQAVIEARASTTLKQHVLRMGFFGVIGADDAFITTASQARSVASSKAFRALVVGDAVRDHEITKSDPAFFPYDSAHHLMSLDDYPEAARHMWPFRTELGNRATFSKRTYFEEGRPWYEWHQLPHDEAASRLSIAFAFVATHNHFVLDTRERAFGRTAPVVKLPISATQDEHFELLGVLNSSTACFWLKQVCFPKSGESEPWANRFEFTATKLEGFPLAETSVMGIARRIDEHSTNAAAALPKTRLASSANRQELLASRERWAGSHARAVGLQEELDWAIYHSYGLTTRALVSVDEVSVIPGERAFEITLARKLSDGVVESAWFSRHDREAITELPAHWSQEYRAIVEERLAEIESNPWIRLLEQPEYKRRWAGDSWDQQLPSALREALLDLLEAPNLWFDASNRAAARSVAQLAQELRKDDHARELAELLVGSDDVDWVVLVRTLIADESVPHVAEMRYKHSGLTKFREWQQIWEMQRAEDRGERVQIPVPPKYTDADFRKPIYKKLRGKLDVPKERFIAYLGANLPNDVTEVYGWAGWSHADRGLALVSLATQLSGDGATNDALLSLFAGIVELEPWLQQWHADVDPAFGMSPAAAISGGLDFLLSKGGLSRADLVAWKPAIPARSRAEKS
ncbi:BREX-2 system adenine-specific DNA-methyltransferase PglX [Mycetocola sp. 2940]|uniref:BREX-2 system adenine-specific DNA-methyltransferase PglX n=1 Tax=Mycetocola sp. 2940 TaxID=3156452 RepID=UPI003397A015